MSSQAAGLICRTILLSLPSKKKTATAKPLRSFYGESFSVVELQAYLDKPWIPSRGHNTEIG
jgi:hypothetical protein